MDVSNNISEIQSKDEILTKDPLEISNEEFEKTEIISISTENNDKKSSVNYKCDFCGKSFSQSGYLNKHIKTIHEAQRN